MNTLNLVYYSPTGTTQKIVREIGRNLGLKLISENNLTQNRAERITEGTTGKIIEGTTGKTTEGRAGSKPEASETCLTIIGVPVYGGRVPASAIEALKTFRSGQTPAVIVVVYGNREYDDALLELEEIAGNCGFKIIAGAAFIGEHTYSSDEKPIAKNRPDKQDLIKCREFAQMIGVKLNDIKDLNSRSKLNVPGTYPYKERKPLPVEVHPETVYDLCTMCGICVNVCPTNAITIHETVETNGELCTWCCACVKQCPHEARVFENPTINAVQERLFRNCSTRKEPVFFV